MDGVDLEFDEKAISAVAKKAIVRKTGARGLRSILEETLLDIMYEIPSREDIDKCTITDDVIEGKEKPLLKLKD